MIKLTELFLLFCKMGIFTFGGGYAMLPILKQEVVDKRHWITQEELLDYYSIGQCTPGIIAVNAASLIGYKLRKISGMLIATLGVIFPSWIIIMLIAATLAKYMDNTYLQHAFWGIRISVVSLIVSTVIDLWKQGCKQKKDYLIFALSILLLLIDFSAVSVIIISLLFSFIPYLQRKKP